MLARISFLSIILLTVYNVGAIAIRKIILQKELSETATQQVVIYHDMHKADLLLAQQQARKIVQAYERQSATSLLMELPPRELQPLLMKCVSHIFNDATELLSNVNEVTIKNRAFRQTVKDVLNSYQQYLDRGTYENDLLYQLSQTAMADQGISLDERSAFAGLIDMMIEISFRPLLEENYHQKDMMLSVKEFFSLLSDFLNRTEDYLKTTIELLTDKSLQKNMKEIVAIIKQGKQYALLAQKDFFKNEQSACLMDVIITRAKNFIEKKDPRIHDCEIDEYFASIFGEYLMLLMQKLTGLNTTQLFEPALLSRILKHDKHYTVIAGFIHADELVRILRKENYKVIYDSYIQLADGRIATSMKEVYLLIGQGDGSWVKKLYDIIMPLDESAYSLDPNQTADADPQHIHSLEL